MTTVSSIVKGYEILKKSKQLHKKLLNTNILSKRQKLSNVTNNKYHYFKIHRIEQINF